mmetsp:Transcript_6885/g.21501  ORF Transcript_6885/g.21501 Transcript_6885/m.21501 type:complete len:231 (-) Transcript_6885:1152-1844(-)
MTRRRTSRHCSRVAVALELWQTCHACRLCQLRPSLLERKPAHLSSAGRRSYLPLAMSWSFALRASALPGPRWTRRLGESGLVRAAQTWTAHPARSPAWMQARSTRRASHTSLPAAAARRPRTSPSAAFLAPATVHMLASATERSSAEPGLLQRSMLQALVSPAWLAIGLAPSHKCSCRCRLRLPLLGLHRQSRCSQRCKTLLGRFRATAQRCRQHPLLASLQAGVARTVQ